MPQPNAETRAGVGLCFFGHIAQQETLRQGAYRIQEVKVVRRDKEYAYVASGLEDGDIIITSPLDTVTDGMKIRTQLTSETVLKESR